MLHSLGLVPHLSKKFYELLKLMIDVVLSDNKIPPNRRGLEFIDYSPSEG